jgi:hypothetical protein
VRYSHSNSNISSPEADLWRNALSKIPTIFERLLYLASLWDPQTGKFHHFGLAQRYGRGRTNLLLRASYLELLRKWTECTIKDQQTQMNAYWAARASSLNEENETAMPRERQMDLTPPTYWLRKRSVFGASRLKHHRDDYGG